VKRGGTTKKRGTGHTREENKKRSSTKEDRQRYTGKGKEESDASKRVLGYKRE